MDCADYQVAIHDYARGILSPERAADVELHMRECTHCIEFNTICGELPCREFVEFLGDYVEAHLSADRRAIFDRHMTVCPECVAYLDSFRRTIELSTDAGRHEVAECSPIPEDLIQAILAAKSCRED